MRQKTANVKAVGKTWEYLTCLYNKCNGYEQYENVSNSALQVYFNINKSTYAACRDLGIVIEHEDYTEWNKQAPDKPMVLLVLDNLLHRRKKPTSDVPIL